MDTLELASRGSMRDENDFDGDGDDSDADAAAAAAAADAEANSTMDPSLFPYECATEHSASEDAA